MSSAARDSRHLHWILGKSDIALHKINYFWFYISITVIIINRNESSQIKAHLSDTKFVALKTTSSKDLTITGTFRQPGDFSIFTKVLRFSCRMFGGHMSILVTTTNTGTERARARPKCSLVMPIIPAFAPIWKKYIHNMSKLIFVENYSPLAFRSPVHVQSYQI